MAQIVCSLMASGLHWAQKTGTYHGLLALDLPERNRLQNSTSTFTEKAERTMSSAPPFRKNACLQRKKEPAHFPLYKYHANHHHSVWPLVLPALSSFFLHAWLLWRRRICHTCRAPSCLPHHDLEKAAFSCFVTPPNQHLQAAHYSTCPHKSLQSQNCFGLQ